MSLQDKNDNWLIFPTVLGHCGVVWRADVVTGFLLPEVTMGRICKELQSLTGASKPPAVWPVWIRALVRQVKLHMKGQLQDFSNVPVYVDGATEFMQRVYTEAQRIPAGSVISYAQLAERLGQPGAVRAVGTALGKNPVPLIIPCHRIITTSGELGGFSAPGGVATKKVLLACEGVSLEKPHVLTTAAQWREGVRYLQNNAQIKSLINNVGDFPFKPQQNAEPLQALIAAIVSQQLSTKVAATILKRVNALVERKGRPIAKRILALDDETLRATGLSYMKVSYLKDLAQHCIDGKFPTLEQVRQMSDEQIIKSFTQIKGIGRWTVEMYLIFDLGRADVFPGDDYGIRKAIAQLYDLPELPPAKQMAQYAEPWKPYRSIASLYLWRLLDNA
ncbi:MAG TPA: methylated-DNA--[protein]-cysteine S-methyltransferase [Pseudomonadales bacterium]|nr:methylated-DNA--[protein]-cysteine S-methyltransferase [Pseudomonadales bacterium]